MSGELLIGGVRDYVSEKLPERETAYTREFRLGIVTGRVSDGMVMSDGEIVGYIVEIMGDTARLMKINPKELNGTLGEELAVRNALEQRTKQFLGKTGMKGQYGR